MVASTTILAIGGLHRLFKLALAAHKVGEKWGLNGDEFAALESLVGASRDFAGSFGGTGGPAPSHRVIALHTAVVTRAFALACGEHWAGSTLAPNFEKRSFLGRLRLSEKEEERDQDVRSRLALALDRVAKLGEGGAAKAFEAVTAMLDDPIASPCYGALWDAFTNPQLDGGEQVKVVELEDPGAKLEFERLFRRAYVRLSNTKQQRIPDARPSCAV